VKFSELDYITTINGVVPTLTSPNIVKRSVTQSKPNLGLLYKVKDSFRVYANYSESYFVNQTDNPVDIASVEYKPETAKGFDYGIKGSFFNDRLNYTIGAYSIRRFNVSVTDNFEVVPGSGVYADVTRRDGDQKDTGWEADVNWAINQSWSTGLSYGHVKAIYTDFGSKNFQAVGRKVQNISPENGSAYLKFNGSGQLKGVSANVGVTHVAETPTENPTQGDNVQRVGGVLTLVSSTNQWKLTVPAFTLWNLGLSYNWRQGTHINHTVRLNVNNVFDKEYLKVNKNMGDPRGVFLSYTLGFSDLLSH
jgi:outer membrane receptor protein involved in Fe transport